MVILVFFQNIEDVLLEHVIRILFHGFNTVAASCFLDCLLDIIDLLKELVDCIVCIAIYLDLLVGIAQE